jgi:uncharacterized protein (TIGR03118 family)
LKKYITLVLPAIFAFMGILVTSESFLASPVYAASKSSGKGFYQETRLVSDIAGLARFTDKDLVNAWGISHSPTGPWVISDNGTGVATAYRGDGSKFPINAQEKIIIPPPASSAAGTKATPTGNVFNNTADFLIDKSHPSRFIFATEDGTISGWSPKVNPKQAILKVDRSKKSAVYKGLAIGHNSSGNFLYAANFHSGNVDMFDAQFNFLRSFTDKKLAKNCPIRNQCYAPFGIQNIQGKLYVTYALQNADKEDDVAGPGHGFVDVFDTNGNLKQRLIKRGRLNSPWGLALASSDFGQFSNDLLVGNFGDGHVNVYDPQRGDFLGQLMDRSGKAIVIDGLWGLAFGNDRTAGASNTLFFAAGINEEANGLFGSIQSRNN